MPNLTAEELRAALESMNPATLAEILTPDVLWYEAGNPIPYAGREAVIERLTGHTGPRPFGTSWAGGTTNEVELHAVSGDESTLLVSGTAKFDRSGRTLGYHFMEHYTLDEGRVAERHSFLDAVPHQVEQFFAAA